MSAPVSTAPMATRSPAEDRQGACFGGGGGRGEGSVDSRLECRMDAEPGLRRGPLGAKGMDGGAGIPGQRR